MKKLEYIEPEMEVVRFDSEDIIASSSADDLEEGDFDLDM